MLFLRVNAHAVSSTWCVHGCDIVLRYERAYIVEWLQKHDTSPATGDNCGGVCRCDARHQHYMLLMFTLICGAAVCCYFRQCIGCRRKARKQTRCSKSRASVRQTISKAPTIPTPNMNLLASNACRTLNHGLQRTNHRMEGSAGTAHALSYAECILFVL